MIIIDRTEVEEFLVQSVKEMCDLKKGGLRMGRKKVHILYSWAEHRNTSWGGSKGISIALLRHVQPYWLRDGHKSWHAELLENHGEEITSLPHIHVEYDSFRNDKSIGTFGAADWKPSLAATLAHELAHVHVSRFGERKKDKPHGGMWRRAYRQLREEFVNSKYDIKTM